MTDQPRDDRPSGEAGQPVPDASDTTRVVQQADGSLAADYP